MAELNKLDDIDRKVVIWCARFQAEHMIPVLTMYQQDYRKKGITLNVQALLTEINHTVCR